MYRLLMRLMRLMRLSASIKQGWALRPTLFQPTLRLRLVLYAGGLSLCLNLILALFINAFASALFPQSTVALTQPLSSLSLGLATPQPIDQSVLTGIQQTLLSQLRMISVIGLALITVLTGVGAYWLAGRTLRSLRSVSHAAQQISASTLDSRLAFQGPTDEVKELADAFDNMLDRLQRAFSQQSQFVADAAHELRTPLATLRTNLDVIMAHRRATLADYHDTSVVMERTLTRLEQLVDSLLVLATDERGWIFEAISLEPLLQNVLCNLEATAQEQQITLHLDCPRHIRLQGDEVLLACTFSNIIENGMQYNKPGGMVTVQVREEAGCAWITISDTGIGIASKHQAHIFDRFYRVDQSRARHRGGAGLGLPIAMHITRQHGGNIGVRSAPGEGTAFTIRLPLLSDSDSLSP